MRWLSYKNIFFDCDSTLTTIEGIDALADSSGKGWRVGVLTKAAMEGEIELEEVYAKRLQALNPTRGQIRAIRNLYKQNVVPDVIETIAALQYMDHNVYIVSGGLAEPVIDFGQYLGIPKENIQAVPIEYDQLSGDWWQKIDEATGLNERFMAYGNNPLVESDGKALIIDDFLQKNPGRSLLIGDGVSDLLASHAVDLFVGFGGVARRSRLQNEATIYFETPTIVPLLAVALGPARLMALVQSRYQELGETCIKLIREGVLDFQSEQLRYKFEKAWDVAYQTIYPRSDRSP